MTERLARQAVGSSARDMAGFPALCWIVLLHSRGYGGTKKRLPAAYGARQEGVVGIKKEEKMAVEAAIGNLFLRPLVAIWSQKEKQPTTIIAISCLFF